MKKLLPETTDSLIFSEKSFYIISTLILLYAVVGTIFLECFYVNYDLWDHVAQISAFRDNLLNPVDPYIRAGNISHILTPYHQLLGMAAQLTGLSSLIILYIAGIFNLIFFLYSVRITALHMFGDSKYSLVVLMVLLGFWIYAPGSSGVYDFSLIPVTLGYPYRAVFPILLIVVSKIRSDLSVRAYLSFSFLTALVFTIHPLSGAFLMLFIGVKPLEDNEWSKRKILVMLMPLFSLILSFFWPYYPVLKFIASAQYLSVFNLPEAYNFYYKTIYTITLLLIPSIITIKEKLKAQEYDFRLLLLTLLTPLLALNYFFFHNEPLARFIVLLTLVLHFLTIEWLITKWLTKRKSYQMAFFVTTGILLVMQIQFSFTTISIFPDILKNKPLGHHSNIRYYYEYQQLDAWIKDGGVILAPVNISIMIARVTRQNVVTYYNANPAIPGTKEKSADVGNYFSTSSIKEKNVILAKYQVKYIVSKENYSSLQEQGLRLKLLGSIDDFPVYQILDIISQ